MRRPSAQSLTNFKNGSAVTMKSQDLNPDTLSLFGKVWKHWFLIGTALSIILSNVWPWIGSDDGPLYPKITVKYGAVISIFFISGITMRTETMMECIKDFKMHIFIQLFSLVLSPLLICSTLVPSLRAFGMSRSLIEGFIVVGCMPPPVSTSVILTKTAGGNEASAIFNSALGSFLGVVVTPIELLMLVDPLGGKIPENAHDHHLGIEFQGGNEEKITLLTRIFVELSCTVVLPIIVGQFLRPRLADKVDGWKPQLSTFSSLTLLVIIYTTFCNTFCDGSCTRSDIRNPFPVRSESSRPSIASLFGHGRRLTEETGEKHSGVFGDLSTEALVATGGIVVLIQLVLMGLAYVLSSSKRIHKALQVDWTRPDIVSILFSSVHKSLTLGVPVLKIVFASSPILPLLSLPLLMYHPIQIVVGGLAAPSIRNWVQAGAGLPIVNPPNKLLSLTPTKATV